MTSSTSWWVMERGEQPCTVTTATRVRSIQYWQTSSVCGRTIVFAEERVVERHRPSALAPPSRHEPQYRRTSHFVPRHSTPPQQPVRHGRHSCCYGRFEPTSAWVRGDLRASSPPVGCPGVQKQEFAI